jgi:hypothetical protein
MGMGDVFDYVDFRGSLTTTDPLGRKASQPYSPCETLRLAWSCRSRLDALPLFVR